jgi:transposase
MPKGVKTSKQLKERVLEAFHNGERQAEISRRFVIPRYTVCRILQNSKERGHLDDILKTGRPRKSSLTTDRLIKRLIKRPLEICTSYKKRNRKLQLEHSKCSTQISRS